MNKIGGRYVARTQAARQYVDILNSFSKPFKGSVELSERYASALGEVSAAQTAKKLTITGHVCVVVLWALLYFVIVLTTGVPAFLLIFTPLAGPVLHTIVLAARSGWSAAQSLRTNDISDEEAGILFVPEEDLRRLLQLTDKVLQDANLQVSDEDKEMFFFDAWKNILKNSNGIYASAESQELELMACTEGIKKVREIS